MVLGVIQRLTWVQSPVVRAVSCPCSISRALGDVLDATLRRYNTTFPSCFLIFVVLRLLDVSSLAPVVSAVRVMVSWSRLKGGLLF